MLLYIPYDDKPPHPGAHNEEPFITFSLTDYIDEGRQVIEVIGEGVDMSPFARRSPVPSMIKTIKRDFPVYEIFNGKEVSAAVLAHAVDIYNDVFIRLGLKKLEKDLLSSDPFEATLIVNILRHETSITPPEDLVFKGAPTKTKKPKPLWVTVLPLSFQ
jgi:hypothetical protein